MAIKSKWVGLHIYFGTNRINLLKECISPLIDELYANKQITCHFYILYEDRGFHIRLRLQTEYDIQVIKYASEKINLHLSNNPTDPERYREPHYFPQDSVQIIDYEPEYERYGGEDGVRIAERQFMYSSDANFFRIKHKTGSTYNKLLNAAFKLHLGTAYVYAEKSIEKAILFFNFTFYKFSIANGPFLVSDYLIENTYSKVYNQQRDVLIPFVKAIWESFETHNLDYNDIDIDTWIKNETEISNLLLKSFKENKLKPPYLFENFPFWSIVHSYMHMTNNRLGISVADEGLISYLLMRSFKEI